MRVRARKMAALLMAVTLMSVSGNPALTTAAYAAEGENVAPTTEVQEVVTEAVTEAPTEAPTEPPTEAPTEPPTEAPTEPPTEVVTEAVTEAPAPAAEVPLFETEAPPAETQPPADVAKTAEPETATEKATEKTTEKKETESEETEEEGKTRSFEAKVCGGKIKIKLPKGEAIAESTKLVCEATDYEDAKKERDKVDKEVLKKQRDIPGGVFFTIRLVDEKDGEVRIPADTKITFECSKGVDLGLKPFLQQKTHLFNVSGDSAQEISADITKNNDLKVTGFSFSAPKKLKAFALIGEQNRENDGAAVSRDSVVSSIGEAGNYAAVGAAVNGDVQDDSFSNNEGILDSLAGYSLTLANAVTGAGAAVVNIYTDEDGHIDTAAEDTQIGTVLSPAGNIDVSGRMVVLNYVVTNPEVGYVALPHYDIVTGDSGDYQEVSRKHNREQAGRFVVTVTSIAEGTDGDYTLQPFTGEVGIAPFGVGTYLVPNGSITIEGKLTGAAYARTVDIGKKIIKSTVRAEYGSDAPEETETETEIPEETESEIPAYDETESEIPAYDETESEIPVYDETESETLAAAELDTETESETLTETETPVQTEATEETIQPQTEAPQNGVVSAAAQLPLETMILGAASKDNSETLKAAADEPYPDGRTLAARGVDVKTYKVQDKSAAVTQTDVKDAKLALYNLDEIKYNDGTQDVPVIPAGTKLCEWTSAKNGVWDDIEDYIVSMTPTEVGPSSSTKVNYVIRELAAGTDPDNETNILLPAWDLYLTCETVKVDDTTITATLFETGTGDSSKASGNDVDTRGSVCTIKMVDAPKEARTVFPTGVITSPSVDQATKEYLDQVEIAVSVKYQDQELLTRSFVTPSGPVDVDITPFTDVLTSNGFVDGTQFTLSFTEKNYHEGYIDYKASDETSGQFYNHAEFTITKHEPTPGDISYEITPVKISEKDNRVIIGTGSPYTLNFVQQPFSFKVQATDTTDSSKFVEGVPYKLMVGDKTLGTDEYQVVVGSGTPSAGTNKTANGVQTITLKDGRLLDNGAVLKLVWDTANPPSAYYYDPVPNPATVEVKNNDQLVSATLTPWKKWTDMKFTIDAICSPAPADNKYVANVPFQLSINGTTLTPNTHYSNVKVTGNGPVQISLTLAGAKELLKTANSRLNITWGATPAGYKYVSENPAKNTALLTLSNHKETGTTHTTAELTLTPWSFKVAAGVDGKTPYIGGVTYDLAGVTLKEGIDYTTTNSNKNETVSGNTVTVTLTKAGADKVQTAGSLTIVGNGPPEDYTISGSYSQSVAADGTYVIPLKEVPKEYGTIVVTKQTRVASSQGGGWYYEPGRKDGYTYIVAAYTDRSCTQPALHPTTKEAITGRMHIPYSAYSSNNSRSKYKYATLEGLRVGKTYYLKETNAPSTVSQILFSVRGGAYTQSNAVTVNKKDEAVAVTLRNVYSKAGLTSGTFKIKLNVIDDQNKPLASALTAEITLRGGDGSSLATPKTIKLANKSTETLSNNTWKWDISGKSGNRLKISGTMKTLKDASGSSVFSQYELVDPKNHNKVIAKGTTIPKTIGAEITIHANDKNKETLEFTLRKLKTEKEIAELKLTKAVTYKKTPIRVNGTYYIGIFEDAAHKKILYKKAMSLSNASSMTSTLKINLYKLKAPHTITLYFAETDKNGKVVSSGKKSGYDISLNKTSVTLSPKNADESIVLTNNVREGSNAAKNLTNPNSGFAGDASALAEAQALSNNESTSSKPTGDDTPYEPFALATGLSAAIIFLLLALLAARRKLRF